MSTPNPAVPVDKQCIFFLKGRCRYGDSCRMTHGVEGGPGQDSPSKSQRTKANVRGGLRVAQRGEGESPEPPDNANKTRGLTPVTPLSAWSQSPGSHGHSRAKSSRTKGKFHARSGQGIDQSSRTIKTGDLDVETFPGRDAEPSLIPLQGRVEKYKPHIDVDSGSHTTRAVGGRVCFAWKAGNCTRGDHCKFSHYVLGPTKHGNAKLRRTKQSQNAAETRETPRENMPACNSEEDQRSHLEQEEVARTIGAREEERREIERKDGEAKRRAQEAQDEIRRAEIAKEEAAVTVKHTVLGSTLISCGAGLEMQRIVSGFDTSWLLVKNLPKNTKHTEVVELLAGQGIDPEHLLVKSRFVGNYMEADILMEGSHVQTVIANLNGVNFRGEVLKLSIKDNGPLGAMGNRPAINARVLKIFWWAPSTTAVASYDTIEEARIKARTLNQKIVQGRRIKVAMNQPPPGRVFNRYRAQSVKISGLPAGVSRSDVVEFAQTEDINLIGSSKLNSHQVFEELRQHLESRMGSFEIASEGGLDGRIEVHSKFEDWEQAHHARLSLNKSTPWKPGYPAFRASLPEPLQFTTTIPQAQYKAQQCMWDSLAQRAKDGVWKLKINASNEHGPVFIDLEGNDKRAVGAAKVQIETLAAGDKLDAGFWHRSFITRAGIVFLNTVFTETGVYVRGDGRTHALKIYGDDLKKENAKRMISGEVSRLTCLEWPYILERRLIGYFVRKGLGELKENLGDDAVSLDLLARKLMIRGGEEARHTLDRVLEQSREELRHGYQPLLEGAVACPVCYDTVSHPVKLGCGHIYCTACIRHYLVSAPETKGFPLVCMGDETRCQVRIPIPVIQRFLTPEQFFHVLDVAFVTYLDHHPTEFRYCTTPDCTQIYRCNVTTSRKCPSCFAEVCSFCHEEAHEGMSCEERKGRKDAEQDRLTEEWASSNGVKRCPSCQVWIEKIEGCNHMTCRCGAHICWKCMKVFDKDVIYQHLRDEHGGPFDNDQIRIIDDRQHALDLQRMFAEEDNPYREFRDVNWLQIMGERQAAIPQAREHRQAAELFGHARQQERLEDERRRQEANQQHQAQGGGCILM